MDKRKISPCWKHCALLVILLSHSVIGSPVITSKIDDTDPSLKIVNNNNLLNKNADIVIYEDAAGIESLNENKSRQKRGLYEALKRYKKIKLLNFGEASSNTAKSVGKSILKTVATLGIKAIIFNFLYTKINQVLDYKNRLLSNLEKKNREQNSQILGIGDATSAGSERTNTSSSTDSPADDIPEFNPEKISLALPDALFSPSFSLANGVSQVIGTLVQNKAQRIGRLFEALKPFLRSSVGIKSKKRESEDSITDNNSLVNNNNDVNKNSASPASTDEESPVKTSYTALTQVR